MEKQIYLPKSLLADQKNIKYLDQYAGCLYGIILGTCFADTPIDAAAYNKIFAKFGQLSVKNATEEIPFCCLYNLKASGIKYDKKDKVESIQIAIYSFLRPMVTAGEKYTQISRASIRENYLLEITKYRTQKILRLLAEFDDMLHEKNYNQIAEQFYEFAETCANEEEKCILLYLFILFGVFILATQNLTFSYFYELFQIYSVNNSLIYDYVLVVYGVYGIYYGYSELPLMPEKHISNRLTNEVRRIFQ